MGYSASSCLNIGKNQTKLKTPVRDSASGREPQASALMGSSIAGPGQCACYKQEGHWKRECPILGKILKGKQVVLQMLELTENDNDQEWWGLEAPLDLARPSVSPIWSPG